MYSLLVREGELLSVLIEGTCSVGNHSERKHNLLVVAIDPLEACGYSNAVLLILWQGQAALSAIIVSCICPKDVLFV